MSVIEIVGVTKEYAEEGRAGARALQGVDLTVEKGEFMAIAGPSGSGKTTLLNLVGALDRATSGTIRIDGQPIAGMGQGALSDRFAGKVPEDGDRFSGVETFTLSTGAPLIQGGAAFLDCRVRAAYPLVQSTLFLLDVQEARPSDDLQPLVYFNRLYHRLCNERDESHT